MGWVPGANALTTRPRHHPSWWWTNSVGCTRASALSTTPKRAHGPLVRAARVWATDQPPLARTAGTASPSLPPSTPATGPSAGPRLPPPSHALPCPPSHSHLCPRPRRGTGWQRRGPPLHRGYAGSTAAGGHTARGGARDLPPCGRPPPTPFPVAGRRCGGPPRSGFSNVAGPGQACESGAPTGRRAPGPAFFWFVLLFLLFLSVFCAPSFRGACVMQEPAGLLAPFFRVFLPLSIGGVRRAAPQLPRGLWHSDAQGAKPRPPHRKPART